MSLAKYFAGAQRNDEVESGLQITKFPFASEE